MIFFKFFFSQALVRCSLCSLGWDIGITYFLDGYKVCSSGEHECQIFQEQLAQDYVVSLGLAGGHWVY